MRKSIALIYAALSAALSLSAAVPPAEKLLPDDTLAVISIPDVSKACEIYRHSPSGRFWSDPAMKPFKDKFFAKVQKECLDPLEHDLGIHFADFTNLLQGQFTLALIQNGWKGTPKDPNEPAFVIILDARDKAPQAATMLSDLKKKWLDSGKTAHIEKIRDVDFSMITLSTNDIPKSLKPKPDAADPAETTPPDSEPKHASKTDLYIGQSGSLLLIGSSPKPLEKILAAQSGSGVKTLTDQPAFTSSAPMFRDAYVFGWVNVKIFIDAIVRSEEDPDAATNPLGLSPSKIVTALGFNGLKSLAFNYRSTPEGAQFNLLLGVPEAQRTGIFKILAGEPKECNPPPFVPADAVKFQRWRINGPKTYDTLHSMIADISPQNAGGLDIFLNAAEAAAREKDPKFDLKKSLVGNLGDDLITYQKSPKSATFDDISSAPSIFLVGSPNPEHLGDSVKLVATSFGAQPTEREFLSHKIYIFAMGAPVEGGKAGSGVGYTWNSEYVAISTDPGMLEEFIRSGGADTKSLRNIAGLADASQKVGGDGTSLLGYSNESEAVRLMLEALKTSPAGTDPLSRMTTMAAIAGINAGQVKLSDWIDVSLLPPFSQISKYFYFSVYAAQATSDGLYFKAFSPAPPGLK